MKVNIRKYFEVSFKDKKSSSLDQFRTYFDVFDLIVIKENDVERVETFKYLAIVLDKKLTLEQNTD